MRYRSGGVHLCRGEGGTGVQGYGWLNGGEDVRMAAADGGWVALPHNECAGGCRGGK